MQVTETLSEGLKREFKIVVPASELQTKVNTRLDDIKDRVRLNGFRPGKVPVAHLKRLYGRSTMAEVIEATVRDANQQIVTDNKLKLAADPKVNLPTEESAIEAVIDGKTDLAYTVAMEIVPAITLGDFKSIKVERLTTDIADAEIDESLKKIAEQNRPYTAKAEGEKAANDDRVVVSFTGTIDGVAFEGGSAEDIPVQLGSNSFIPGFEEQLVGIGAGETRIVKVTFPTNYANEQLKGKDAQFEVTAKSVEAPGQTVIDEELAKSLGMESLAKVRDALRERLQQEINAASRQKIKRELLDRLDEQHKFEPPPSLVEDEFDRVWKSVVADLESEKRSFADENTTEDKAKEEYRRLAERRVRLGLVLAEIGEKNNITVSEEELTRAVSERIRQYPGQEKRIWEYYQQNPGALGSLRAPIYEEKVVDFLLELATVTEKKVSKEELFKEDDRPVA